MDSDDNNKEKISLDSDHGTLGVLEKSQSKVDNLDEGRTSKIELPIDDLEDLCLDFESFGKKKKKKKKPINWDELDEKTSCTSKQAQQLGSRNIEFGEENENITATPTPTPTPNESPNITPTARTPRTPRINENIEDTLELDFSLTTKKSNTKEPSDLGVDITNEEEKMTYDDDDLSLDFESFGRKKKKKKKTITLVEVDDVEEGLCTSTHSLVLTSKSNEQIQMLSAAEETEVKETCDMTPTLSPTPMETPTTQTPMPPTPPTPVDDEIELDIDFSLGKKKKKSKKKELNDLGLGDKNEDKLNQMTDENDPNAPSWAGSSRDYTYDELLKRVFDIMLEKNPELATGRKPKFIMRPPQVLRVGSKKTYFANFMDIAKTLHRLPKHLLDFLLAELGTSGSMDGNQQLIIKGRFQAKQIENVLRRYIKEYVTCHTCRSPETILQKNTRLFFLQCESCGSRCSVASIKSGFQAVTSKRAAIRAKYT